MSKQAWIILGSIVGGLMLLGVGMMGYFGFQWAQSGDKVAQEMFGNKLPKGYIAFGASASGKIKLRSHLVTFLQPQTGKILVVVANTNPASKNPSSLSDLDHVLALMGGRKGRTHFEKVGQDPLTIANTAVHPIAMRLVCKDSLRAIAYPGVVTQLMYANHQTVLLIELDPKSKVATDKPVDFTSLYPSLESDLGTVIGTTPLAKNLAG